MGRDSAAKTSANPQRQGLIAGLLAAVFFGLSAPLISVISGEASPLMIAALLYTGAALALLMVRPGARAAHLFSRPATVCAVPRPARLQGVAPTALRHGARRLQAGARPAAVMASRCC